MDLLLIALVAIAMLILAIRRRRRPRSNGARPAASRGGWSFSRHPKEDWRYWRDLAALIALGLLLLIAMVMLAGTGES